VGRCPVGVGRPFDATGATSAIPFEPHDVELLRQTVVELRERMGAHAFDAAFAHGRQLGNRDVVEFASLKSAT
jgi:hypothetical protein